ncbi:hypothetical protein SOVF_181370, partial [Spinacia oleracea]
SLTVFMNSIYILLPSSKTSTHFTIPNLELIVDTQ